MIAMSDNGWYLCVVCGRAANIGTDTDGTRGTPQLQMASIAPLRPTLITIPICSSLLLLNAVRLKIRDWKWSTSHNGISGHRIFSGCGVILHKHYTYSIRIVVSFVGGQIVIEETSSYSRFLLKTRISSFNLLARNGNYELVFSHYSNYFQSDVIWHL